MDFEQAKSILLENTVGFSDYDNISTWAELKDAAEFEQSAATDRIRQLGSLIATADDKI